MKIFIITLCALFICTVSHAQTETMNWYVEGALYDTTTCESGGDIDLPAITPTKRGYTFQGWWTYTPIEYLESTGTQWIDTGYTPNTNTHIKAKIKFNSVNNNQTTVFGGGTWYYNNSIDFYIWERKLQFNYGQQYIYGSTLYVGDIVEIDFNKNLVHYSVNGIQQNTIIFNNYSFVSPFEMRLYAVKNRDNVDAPGFTGLVDIYYFQIYDNDVLVRDFVPVLDYNGVPCMFDKVSETFFYNKGTGDFIAGPIVAEE